MLGDSCRGPFLPGTRPGQEHRSRTSVWLTLLLLRVTHRHGVPVMTCGAPAGFPFLQFKLHPSLLIGCLNASRFLT